MHEGLTLDRLRELRGTPVFDEAGEKIGKVEEVFTDTTTGRPRWLGLGTGMFGTKRVLVPVDGATASDDGVTVPYAKDHVKDAPDCDADVVSGSLERELLAFYGLGGTDAQAAAPTTGDATVTRSEEELAVGKRQVEAGAVRLHKWVEEVPVDADVEVRRERAHVTREPIEQPVAGHEFGEEHVEVPIHAEEPVVEKRAVAKERVSVGTDTVAETQTVSDTLRKERVDVDGVENVDDVD